MVYVFADVFEEIMLQVSYKAEPCLCILTGGYHQGPTGEFIEIQGFSSTSWVDSTMDSIELLEQRHALLRREFEAQDTGARILGWSHGLPGSAGQMNEEVAFVHLTFFNLPFQVCMILDPEGEKVGVFRRGEAGAMHNIGFKLISAKQASEPETKPPVSQEESVITDKTGHRVVLSGQEEGPSQNPQRGDIEDERDH